MRILIADDDEITRLVLATTLRKRGYEVVEVCDGAQAFDVLQQEDAPRIAVLDWLMPEVDGIELCGLIRGSTTIPYVYIIMLTSRSDKQDFAAAMDAGADDFISKPFDSQELHWRVRAGERLVLLQEELRARSRSDDLTGLLNRSAIVECLTRACARAARDSTAVAVLLVDVDNFKSINDTHGHSVGDAVLRRIAALLGAGLRGYDVLGRYGGEEFLVVLPGCGSADAIEAAERLRTLVAKEPVGTGIGRLSTTVSIGVAVAKTGNLGPEHLIEAADGALYRAKRAGRNRVE